MRLNETRRDVEIFGASPPGFFVGHEGYPDVRLGPLVPLEADFTSDAHLLDAPEEWYGTSLPRIVQYRSALVRTSFRAPVHARRYTALPLARVKAKMNPATRRLLETSQELAMAARPVDTETHLDRVRSTVQFDTHALPMGPSGTADRIRIVENTKVHPVVDKVVADVDLRAADAVFDYLYADARLDFTPIQRVFSAGLLGQARARKLVPTRWTVTAVDDIVGKRLVADLKQFPEIGEYQLFEATYLDNRFAVLLIPGPWAFEMMEVWAANSLWNQPVPGVTDLPRTAPRSPRQTTPAPGPELGPASFFTPASRSVPAPASRPARPARPQIVQDAEFHEGRTRYAGNVTGAYYAARVMVAAHLHHLRRQARAVVFREVSDGYLMPLGVWVIRESVREALAPARAPRAFDTLDAAFLQAVAPLQVPARAWFKASELLPYLKTQKTLDAYFHATKG